MMRNKYRLVITFFTAFLLLNAQAQFYNGHQMSFGKNRVQHYNYYWSYYRFDDFDCYFNEFGRDLAQFTANYAQKKLDEIEGYFDYDIEKRMIFVIYNKNNEYRQSNIGLVTFDDESYNTGGYSRIINNKVMLYYEGDHVAYQKQIAASITEVIIKEMLYNADFRDRISSSSTIYMPEWYIKGLVNYVSSGWDYETENRVKDGIRSGKYKNLNHLEFDDAINAGHSFWRFIGRKYGDALIPNIIYLTKVYRNIDDGFLYVLGVKLKDLIGEWKDYYNEEYASDRNLPGDENTLRKARNEQIYQQVKISPDRKFIAYVTNDWGRKRIWLYDQASGKTRAIFRAEPRYEHKTDNTYPVIGWHPSGRILTYINEEKAGMVIYFYRTEEEKTEKRNFLYFDKVLDFSYSPEGTRIILSAVKDGITDIYIHTVASGINDQITRDVADDLQPSFFGSSGKEIIFSSNRLTDTLVNDADPFEKLAPTFDLFTYDIEKRNNVLLRLAEGKYSSRYQASSTDGNNITYIGDYNGVLNRYTAVFDSAISFIDTTTHYMYYLKSDAVTNYDRNISHQSVQNGSDEYGEVIFRDGRYRLRKGSPAISEKIPESEIIKTNFRKEQDRLLFKADSIDEIRKWIIAEDKKRRDTLTKPLYEYYFNENEPINISHYIFEKEKQNFYEQQWRKKYMDIDLDTAKIPIPLIRIYETSFYNNYIANQVDFTFLNNSYQVFNGGSSYYNPGINLLTRIGILDLFEDYRITGGFRFAGDFDSNEYLLSFESLKGKFDKQFIFHRQGYFSSDGYDLFKTHTHNFYISYAKPITPVLALKGTLSYRYDRNVTLAQDITSLISESFSQHWGGLKGEVIFDNTRKRNVNIYFGTRFKVFGEYYRQITENKSDMFVIGGDFRKYIRIHRELIWANRFAASSSFGPTKLVYYLGGVDNWMGYLFNKYPMFDNTIPVSPNQNYGFQAIATNLRGFSQNARNGNNFALINSEIRWPFVRYFAGHPLKSNFLNSLQVVGFYDIGTAWTGVNPWSGENAYDTETYENGPVQVVVDSNKAPIVSGFGAGLRAQLMGYFIRADWAWGIEDGYILPRIFYLSFSLDF